MNEIRASVLIPTHAHAATLPLAVHSVLRQSVRELEVIIIGDGATDGTREAALALVHEDPRVRFLDFPKGPHHGEIYRHEAIVQACSDAILYLCDDDLLLPEHVADILELLRTRNFAQSRNGYFTAAGGLRLYPTDLADPVSVAWHLREPPRNRVSVTGTAHSRAFYLGLHGRWETTPDGEWPDHFMWKKFFTHSEFSGATSARITALQFPTSGDGRHEWTDERRHAELAPWAELVAAPFGQERIDALVEEAARSALQVADRDLDLTREALVAARNQLAHPEAHDEKLALAEKDREIARLRSDLDAMQASRSWRLTSPLRRALRLLRRS